MQIQPSTMSENHIKHSSISCDNYVGRKKLELNRRMTLLQYKRSCLERDLRAINSALLSLTKQLG